MKLVFDPGHGDTPASKRGFLGSTAEHNEGVNNWITVQLIIAFLKSRYLGEFITTRPNRSGYPTLAQRGAMAKGADLFYSRHSNAFSDKSVRGTEMWVGTSSSKASALSAELAKNVSAFFGHRNRGLKNGDNYAVVRYAKAAGCPMAIMAECGFHTNEVDADMLVNKRVELAEIEAETIAQFMNLEVKPVEKRELDTAEKWAVDNGIMQDMKWDEPATRSQMAWWLFMLNRKFIEPLKK